MMYMWIRKGRRKEYNILNLKSIAPKERDSPSEAGRQISNLNFKIQISKFKSQNDPEQIASQLDGQASQNSK